MKHTIALLLYILVSARNTHGQKLIFDNKSVHQGLPATEVYHLYKDGQGYIWAFTEFGIVKYNGSQFISVCKNIPLRHSAVYAIARSGSGNLFMANSQAEIYQVKNDSAFRIAGMERLSAEILAANQLIVSIYADDSENLYVSTFMKTYKILRNTYTVPGLPANEQNAPPAPGRDANKQYHIFHRSIRENTLILEVLDSKGGVLFSYPYTGRHYSRFPVRNNGETIYFSTTDDQQVISYRNGIVNQHEFERPVICMETSDDGHIWVGLSNGGLYELDADLNLLGHYLGTVTVSDVLFDDQGGMWASTTGAGVYHCSNREKLSYANIPGLRNSITLLEILDSKLFIGTEDGHLFVKENDAMKPIDLGGNTSRIHDIAAFDGQYYIATANEALIMDRAFGHVRPAKLPPNNYAFAVNGDTLFSASSTAVCKLFRGNKGFINIKLNQRPRSIVRKSAQEMYISSGQGLYVMGTHLSCPDYLSKLRGVNICRLRMDARGNTWICTKGYGLFRLSADNTITRYRHLPSQIINDISFIGDSIVLLSTNKGAFFNSLKNLNRKRGWISLLDEETLGMQYYRGRLYIATKSGLTTLAGNRLLTPVDYPFYLRSVRAGHKRLPLRRIVLGHTENDLSFYFDLLDYRFRDRRLHYDLHGPVQLHGMVSGTRIDLQNLEPGFYLLYVYPDMRGMNGPRKMITVPFYIEPAFWQTTLFRGLVVLVVIMALAIILLSVSRKRRRRNAIEKLLYEYRLTAIRSQINPHFMSNALVAIQQLILSNDADNANHYLVKFSLLIRHLLSYSDKTVVSLADELKINDLYIELEQLRFSNHFVFRKEIGPEIDLEKIFIPTLITQPLMENAVWHGLLPMAEAWPSELVLRIFTDGDELHMAIRDNGAGRKQADPGNASAERESKGVLLIRNRIQTLNKLYGADARIVYTDHADDRQQPTGTTVTLVIPLTMLNKMYHDRNQEYYR